MKKTITYFILLGCLYVLNLVSSCQKASTNGYLDGRWQVMEILSPKEDWEDRQRYFNFYRSVCNLSYYGGIFTEGNVKYEYPLLELSFPYITEESEYKELSDFGIESNPVIFTVEKLTSKQLILKEGDIRIILRKF